MRREALILSLAVAAAGCLERRDNDQTATRGECASCHGTANATSSELVSSAPPSDLFGNQDPRYPGVGAHTQHLLPGETHGAVACEQCHVVPETVHAPGHLDSDRPAELVFGALASQGEGAPTYDPSSRRCSNSYCHGADEPTWTAPRSSAETCGSCHGLPPPPPHPDVDTACAACHTNLADDRAFVRPEQHVDGTVQVVEPPCGACHGRGDDPAPPPDASGNDDPSNPGVGAHSVHLAGGMASRAVRCDECHTVPQHSGDPGHLDPAPAELIFTGVALASDRTPSYDVDARTCADSWCHSPSDSGAPSPAWTDAVGPLACTSCHGMPPAPPHPQMSECALCHGEVAGPGLEIRDRSRHVDGMVDVIDLETLSCTACHGDSTAAPPPDLQGELMSSAPGVGAHESHLRGSDWARPVSCEECHIVPDAVRAPGHLDDALPAEVVFSGVARAFGATPTYENGVCANSFCHGESFVAGHSSGGSNTRPRWTTVDGSQAACGTCHGLPPPPPHPPSSDDCSGCHENVAADGSFLYPELHVDGEVTFFVP